VILAFMTKFRRDSFEPDIRRVRRSHFERGCTVRDGLELRFASALVARTVRVFALCLFIFEIRGNRRNWKRRVVDSANDS
jgi:hypothetical protein